MIWIRIAAALIAWVAFPAFALAAFGCRRRDVTDTPERFLTLATTFGLTIWMLLAAILALGSALSLGPVVVVGVALVMGSTVLLIGPARPGLGVLAGRDGAIAFLASYGVTAVVSAPLLASIVARTDSLRQPTPWYYWQLVRETVVAHGVPKFSMEWGLHVPFLNDYPGYAAGSAVLSVAGGNPVRFAGADALQVIAILTAGAGIFLLARAWHATTPAAAVAVGMFFALDISVVKLSSYRPESAAYGLAFVIAALAKRWVDDRRRLDLVAAGCGLLVLPLVHPVVWVLALGMAGGTALGGLSRDRRARVAALIGVAVATGGFGVGVFGSSLGGTSKLGGLPSITATGIDPTWTFQSRVATGLFGPSRPANATLALGSFKRGFLGLGWPWHVTVAALLVVALAVIGLVIRAEIRPVVTRFLVFVGGVVAAVGAVSFFFVRAWSTYVPNRTGVGRLLTLAWFLLPIAAAVALSLLAPRRLRTALVAITAILVVIVLVHGAPNAHGYARQQPSRAAVRSLEAIDLPPRSLVLANAYTEGVLRLALGAPGLLEGRAPYTERTLLKRANRLLASASAFFATPKTRAIPGHGVTHVLVATGAGWTLTTPFVMPTNIAALDTRPDLVLDRTGPGWRLYRVRSPR